MKIFIAILDYVSKMHKKIPHHNTR